jgi:hypothetical protein
VLGFGDPDAVKDLFATIEKGFFGRLDRRSATPGLSAPVIRTPHFANGLVNQTAGPSVLRG